MKVAVLGAGPMGLAVAYKLSQLGVETHVFEADDRIGGMSATFDFDGIAIERFYHFHCLSDFHFLKTLKELGLENELRWASTEMGFWFNNRLQDWGNPLALMKFEGLGLVSKLRYAMHALYCTKLKRWEHLDRIYAVPWLEAWAGKQAFNVLWRKLIFGKFFEFSEQVSAAWIWSRIRRIGLSRQNIFTEKLGYLIGGSATLLEAIVHYIQSNGGTIHLKEPVNEVISKNQRISGVVLENGFHAFDAVVSTVPIPFVSKLVPTLPENIRSQYCSIENIGVVCGIAKLRKPVSKYFWVNVNDDEFLAPGLIEYSNLCPTGDTIVYTPYYMPQNHENYSKPDSFFELDIQNMIKKINPDLTDEDFVSVYINRYKYAQPVCGPQFRKKLPNIKTPINGLYVADTSYYYPEDRGISESLGLGFEIAQMVEKNLGKEFRK